MSFILCTGTEPVLLQTRKLLLEHAGHTVITTTDQRALVAACNEHRFDVAVIGQTVAPPVKRLIASHIREHCPSAKILELYPSYEGKAVEDADAWLETPVPVPENLAETVNELIADPRPAKVQPRAVK